MFLTLRWLGFGIRTKPYHKISSLLRGDWDLGFWYNIHTYDIFCSSRRLGLGITPLFAVHAGLYIRATAPDLLPSPPPTTSVCHPEGDDGRSPFTATGCLRRSTVLSMAANQYVVRPVMCGHRYNTGLYSHHVFLNRYTWYQVHQNFRRKM